MKQFYLLLLTLFCQALFAQNWQPLMRKDTINFKHKDSLFITQTVWVETLHVPNTGDTIFRLNETLHYFAAPNQSLCTNGIATHLPHFLQKQAIKKADSTWLFHSPNVTYLLKPFAAMNDIWLFDSTNNITANVLAIDTFSVVGQLDSIKVISLSSGDSILLSKNYGLMRFPTFDSTLYVSWAGIENRNIGESVFDFREIFDFEIGDVFYYDVYHASGYGATSSPTYKKLKTTITSKTNNSNSISYDCHIDMQTKTYPIGGPVFSITNFDIHLIYDKTYFYNTYPVGNTYLQYYWGDSMFMCYYARIEWDNTWNCLAKNFPYRYFNNLRGANWWVTDTLWGGSCFEQIYINNIKYGKGIGLIAAYNFVFDYGVGEGRHDDTTLVGYIKNSISVGTIYPDWQFTSIENPQNDFFTLSPNPVKDQLCISFSKGNSFNIRIWDMQGREKVAMSSPNSSITFHINDWVKGLYFVEVRDEKGNVHTEKFVKE